MNRILFALLILFSSYSTPETRNVVSGDEWIVTCVKMELDTVKQYEQYLFCLKNPKDGTLVETYCKRYYMDNNFSDGSELKDSTGFFLGYIKDPFMLEVGDTINLEN